MIDIEAQIYTPIHDALLEQYPGISVSGVYVNAPPSFPHVSFIEADNHPIKDFLDSGDKERLAAVMYEISVYSNKGSKKKSECREIMNFIDRRMYLKNFTRLSCNPVPNLADASIYRLVARYQAACDGEILYRWR